MTREERILIFARQLYSEGFRLVDADEIRHDYTLTPYEAEIVITEIKRLENEN